MFTCFPYIIFFFFKQKTAYEMRISDWSSDVFSSDLAMPTTITDEVPRRCGIALRFIAVIAIVCLNMRYLPASASTITSRFERSAGRPQVDSASTTSNLTKMAITRGGQLTAPPITLSSIGKTRSEEHRVGNEGVPSCTYRCGPTQYNKTRSTTKHN